jgi:hypothetical protein
VTANQDYRIGYKLPQKGTTVEAFLDFETASCGLGVFGEQMSPAQRNAYKDFLQNVSKEPVKLKWNKASGRFDLPPGAPAAAVPGKSILPGYADYPVKERFSGRPAAPDLKSNPDAKQFASVLKEGAAKGPDFAGHYTVVMWGCGAGCQSFVIVDAKTGSIYTSPFSSEAGVCYRLDSALFIVDPIREDVLVDGTVPARMKTTYYAWDGEKMNPVGESRSVTGDENCK